MTGCHIRKLGDGQWEYPDHERLREKCNVLRIEEYIEKRRDNLRRFLIQERKALRKEAQETRPPARDVRKILWGRQKMVSTEEEERGEERGGEQGRRRT